VSVAWYLSWALIRSKDMIHSWNIFYWGLLFRLLWLWKITAIIYYGIDVIKSLNWWKLTIEKAILFFQFAINWLHKFAIGKNSQILEKYYDLILFFRIYILFHIVFEFRVGNFLRNKMFLAIYFIEKFFIRILFNY
jgi:hypothetical protein